MVELKGKDLRDKLLLSLKEQVKNVPTQLGLAVIQIGDDEASKVYVGQKEKLAVEMGYKFIHKVFNEDVHQQDVLNYIEELNNDDTIDGILVQMPLPKHLDTTVIQNTIDPNKDVDGLTFINAGRLVQNMPSLVPCTPMGIIDILDNYNIPIEGKKVVVIGRSILVGKPIANMLTNRNASVSVCHSRTTDISSYTKNADIIVVAVGKAKYLTSDMVNPGAVIIDVGINRIDGKLIGDVDYENVAEKASYITPVPGGVGPMTVYELMHNVYLAHQLREKNKIDKLEETKRLELTLHS
ncbi:MAG: bifunctional 5,10-methylenetetrahydrofolate dehydrogenase/5,10-methenyltetrahydrofolate cyclohydrolase [Bacilli bacterium]|nr:bifunctional 5,10-methylenetetrahydrofolate dehydrogenase/5,10-methenyltetrahydrofolate cyclohydrolase [Bacilli bacterium]